MSGVRVWCKGLAAALLVMLPVMLSAGAALADCADPAAPGVNWQRCFHAERPFINTDLQEANIRGANFARGDLSGSNLSRADGRRAKFFSTIIRQAVFDNANLAEADFTKADLSGTSLKQANLRAARLFRANLRDADLTGAILDRTDFLDADLSGALWVDGKKRCAEGSISRCL